MPNQSIPPAIFSSYGLSIENCSNLSDDAEEYVTAAAEALEDVSKNDPEGVPKAPNKRARHVITAARDLIKSKKGNAAIALVDGLPQQFQSKRPIVLVRLTAHWQMGQSDKLAEEAERAIKLFPDDPQIKPYLSRKAAMHITETVHDSFDRLGIAPETLVDALNAIDASQVVNLYPDERAKSLSDLRNEPDPEDFAKRLRNGGVIARYMTDLLRHRPNKERNSERDKTLLRYSRQAEKLLKEVDASIMEKAVADGHPVIVTSAHTSLNVSLSMDPFANLGLPVIRVANQGGFSNPGFERFVVNDDSGPFEFLKLVKRIRKNQLCVVIYPDGAKSRDVCEVEVLGRKVPIGPGAEMLAWQGKAATFFVSTHWNGRSFWPRLTQGPSAFDFETREEFEKSFHEFYADRLTELVLGEPEDIGSGGGFIPVLTRLAPRKR